MRYEPYGKNRTGGNKRQASVENSMFHVEQNLSSTFEHGTRERPKLRNVPRGTPTAKLKPVHQSRESSAPRLVAAETPTTGAQTRVAETPARIARLPAIPNT